MDSYNLQELVDNRLQSQAEVKQKIEGLLAETEAFQAATSVKIADLTVMSHQYQGQIALLQALMIKGAVVYLPVSAPLPEEFNPANVTQAKG